MEEIETKLLNVALKGPSKALDRKILFDTENRPTVPVAGHSRGFKKRWSLARMAATVLAVVALVSFGWAGEKVCQKVCHLLVEVEKPTIQEWTLPDGQKMVSCQSTVISTDPSDPNGSETAKRHYDEMKRLIGEKKFELLKTFDDPNGKQYVYRFTFADGSRETCNYAIPLDQVSSWDDYQQKVKALQKQRQKQIHRAIANGKYRLLDASVYYIHVCRDTATNRKFRVQRLSVGGPYACISVSKNKTSPAQSPPDDMALVFPLDGEDQIGEMSSMSWQEHLDAIRKGDRVLLSLDTVPSYTYEITLDDGTTTIFNFSGKPLQNPDAEQSGGK